MSKIFVHLGAHKTASSFIQANLRANAAVFEQQGWTAVDLQTEYPEIKSSLVKVRSNRQLKRTERAAMDQFFAQLHKPRDIFLSYEGFLGSMNLREGEIYANHAAHISTLKEGLAGRNIQIGFCVRNFADLAESSYSFGVVKGRNNERFSQYAKKISIAKLTWLKIIERLSDAFGAENLVLWTYEDFKRDGVRAFTKIIEAAGIDSQKVVAAFPKPRNVSPTVEQVRLLRDWHKAIHEHLSISSSERRTLNIGLRALVKKLPHDSETKGHCRPKRRGVLTEHYERELAIIRERWGSRMLDFGT